MAEETGCAVVIFIGHMNKGGTKSGYRGLGSIDITAAVRSVLVVGKSPQDPTRIMAHSKSNPAPAGASIVFELGDTFRFLGTSSITVDELLGFEQVKRNVLEEAKTLLLSLLSDGKQESNVIFGEAQQRGISDRTIKTAKKELGIESLQEGNKWYFYPPKRPQGAK